MKNIVLIFLICFARNICASDSISPFIKTAAIANFNMFQEGANDKNNPRYKELNGAYNALIKSLVGHIRAVEAPKEILDTLRKEKFLDDKNEIPGYTYAILIEHLDDLAARASAFLSSL